MKEYLNTPQEEEDCDFLLFCKRYAHHWPCLASVAKAVLAVLAFSSPSERTVSASSRLMTNHFSFFFPMNFEAQICLKS